MGLMKTQPLTRSLVSVECKIAMTFNIMGQAVLKGLLAECQLKYTLHTCVYSCIIACIGAFTNTIIFYCRGGTKSLILHVTFAHTNPRHRGCVPVQLLC